MEISRATVPIVRLVPVPEAEAKRPRRSVQERRQIVEETLAPGASVARVTLAQGVNANRVLRCVPAGGWVVRQREPRCCW
jgi:hypothetical protein